MVKVLQVLLVATLPTAPQNLGPAAATYIDRAHPEVLRMQRLTTAPAGPSGSVAARIHRMVRGGAKFGWTSSFQPGGVIAGGEEGSDRQCADACGDVALESGGRD